MSRLTNAVSRITVGNRVYLDDSFQYLSPYRQTRLLGHEGWSRSMRRLPMLKG